MPSAHPYLLVNYQGKVRDVMTLAHELGHGCPPGARGGAQGHFLSDTPLTLAETASVFGEMLTFQALLKAETDPARRKVMLASKVEDMLNTVVRQIALHPFEAKVHDERRRGELAPSGSAEIWLDVQPPEPRPALRFDPDYQHLLGVHPALHPFAVLRLRLRVRRLPGSAQRFGVPMGYGGPHAAYMAVRDALKRSLPGRIVGLSINSRGQPAYRLALQTREQHIRREKATSNICTAQVLLAVIASMYAVYHGPEGLTHIARKVHRRTAVLAAGLRKLGFAPRNEAFFDTMTVDAGPRQSEIVARALTEKINLRIGQGTLGIALDETTTPEIVEAIWRAFGGKLAYADIEADARDALPPELKRTSAFLGHPVFHAHRSETELLRYMRKLSDRDLALDRAMIPLGSCTMKLNATSEMIPLTWPEFGALHPFAPREQANGYHALFARLEKWLCDITGYDAISLQPNSGAQGEYAGLLAIRGYHAARGEPHRKVCLIPSSAHGTNPASAHMAGMEVVVVACDIRGAGKTLLASRSSLRPGRAVSFGWCIGVRAASRAAWTAGKSRAIRTAMMAMTTNNSIRVNPRTGLHEEFSPRDDRGADAEMDAPSWHSEF